MTPFQKIPEACKTTGLSQYFLRKGCKDGSIPHIRSGPTYYIDVPALLRKLGGKAVGRDQEVDSMPRDEAGVIPGR